MKLSPVGVVKVCPFFSSLLGFDEKKFRIVRVRD
jgi:hypothetical protein